MTICPRCSHPLKYHAPQMVAYVDGKEEEVLGCIVGACLCKRPKEKE